MNKEIAIDGPAGAGKSTIAKKVAEKLGLVYVDTGAMFRGIALYMTEKGIEGNEVDRIKTELEKVKIDIVYEDGEQQLILNDENVSKSIRKPEISKAASAFATIPEVRTRLLNLQRELAAKRPVVMDGRDIGSKVLPEATVKIFLTADVNVRAERRYKELTEKGENVDIADIMADIKSRDEQDIKRAVSPLTQAEDAVLVDTSSLSIDEVVDTIIKIACEKNPEFNK
ncbi:cytidylate kinase [Catonella morbi ATCC 51271]|uniref:Cytidylate kinase n=1 Tax=Catonella morbi ATCC 51271 TaxID=592026 RepID=V2Y8I4_9FIRM|nr:(d)CMP kinase [Catonella morbi]ESL04417.1 cytidylate kinase [Catonella morbi ATCC 51271]